MEHESSHGQQPGQMIPPPFWRSRYPYITNTYAGSVSVIDIKAQKIVATIGVGKGPTGISVRP